MISFDQQVEKSDTDTIELALLALKESENGLPCTIEKNTLEVQLVGGGEIHHDQGFRLTGLTVQTIPLRK